MNFRYPSTRNIVPIGATITVGRKGSNGAPVDKDRYFIQSARADGSGREGRRYMHPDFTTFNALWDESRKADIGTLDAYNMPRKTIRGVLVHSRQEQMHERRLQAYKLPDMPEAMSKTLAGRPACQGDGCKALRWDGKEFKEIDCVATCKYRVKPEGKPAACKIHSRLFFQLRWADVTKDGVTRPSPLSTPLVQYSTNGWESSDAMDGMFTYVRQQAAQLGVGDVDFYGFPFRMTLEQRTSAANRSRFSVTTFTPDFTNGDTIQSWLMRKATMRSELQVKYLEITSDEAQAMIPEVVDDLTPGFSVKSEPS